MTVALPQHVCVLLSGAWQHRAARSSCAAASSVRSSTLRADTVRKFRNSPTDVVFTQELMASMQPTISWAGALSASDFVTEFSGAATPDEYGVAQSSSSELATQRLPSQP